jgi:hypothetical protein
MATTTTTTPQSTNAMRLEVLTDLAFAMAGSLDTMAGVNRNAYDSEGNSMSELERDVLQSVERSLDRVRQMCVTLKAEVEQE